MKRKKRNNRLKAWLTGIIGVFFFCAGCDDPESSSGNGKGDSEADLYEAYVTINLRTLTEEHTRSNPTGGEKGDGEENAFDYESQINELTVLFYPATDLNSSLNTEIAAGVYIGSADMFTATTTKVKKVKVQKGIYQLIVIANAGDLTDLMSGFTVREVADYLLKSGWEFSGGTYRDFVMTSASESSVDFTVFTSEAKPAEAKVDIQRVAARIDIIPNQDNEGKYKIVEGGQELAEVTVEKAKLINRLTAGTYLLKRVADSPDDTPVYLGKETPQNGIQTNYVLDPWIRQKTKENLSGGHFDLTNGGAGSSPATSLYTSYFDTSFTLTAADQLKKTLSGKDFYILDYVLENTLQKDHQLNGYTTGISYETTYLPLKITTYNSSKGTNEVVDNNAVITFFVTDEDGIIYNSPEAMTAPFLQGNQPDNFFTQTFTTSNTWQDLSDYAQRLSSYDPLSFRIYLDQLLENKPMSAYLDQDVSWSAYLLSVYGIISNGFLAINQNRIETKELLRNQGIKMYEEGRSYYTYWIRHSNDNSIDSSVMEFGIVRNNIYKLQIVSFSGLGKPEPYDPYSDDPENPDEESFVRVTIYVRPWNLLTHREIIL